MLKSKYWGKLFKNNSNSFSFSHRKDYIIKKSSDYQFNEIELNEISQFYAKKYRVNKSNITQNVTLSDFKRYFNLGIELLAIYSMSNELFGVIISFYVPIFFSDNLKQSFPYTSFLVVDDKYRGKGFGMALIQESLKVLHTFKCDGAYFVNNVPRGKNSIKMFTWFYPFNFSKIRSSGFLYPAGYENNFQIKYEDRIEKATKDNNGYQFYIDYLVSKNLNELNNIYFSPSIIYWEKWIEVFHTYLVYQNEKIIGLFSIDTNILYGRNYLNQANLLICIGQQPETINASITMTRKNFDVLIMHELGDLTYNLLKSIFAQGLYSNYINFYNTDLKLTSKDFYMPIF